MNGDKNSHKLFSQIAENDISEFKGYEFAENIASIPIPIPKHLVLVEQLIKELIENCINSYPHP